MPPSPAARMWRLVCLRPHFCTHCFDGFLRPALPTLACLTLWLGVYVASYSVCVDPEQVVKFKWPDGQAQVVRQTMYAPLLKLDPRVKEAIAEREAFRKAIPRSDNQAANFDTRWQ